MELINKVWDWINGTRSLDRISIEDMKKERLRLEQYESRITREVDSLERRKRYLFDQGAGESAQRKQIILARKIKELDLEVQSKDRQLALLSRQLRVITGLITLRENDAMMAELGIEGVVSKLDMAELQAYVDQATVEGRFQLEKFAQMMRGLESGESIESGDLDDVDTLAIVQAMQDARQAGLKDPESSQISLESGMKQVDDMLHHPHDEDEGKLPA